MQQLCKLKPSVHLPIVRTAAALRAMFWLGFPWARSHKTPDMERPLVPYPKRSVRPCKNREQRAIHHGSEGIRSQDKQYSTVDYFKVQIYLYICARCPTRAFGTGEYTSQELSAFKLDTPTGDQSLSNQVWHHFTTVLMIWQSYLSDQPTWSKQYHHRTQLAQRGVRTENFWSQVHSALPVNKTH